MAARAGTFLAAKEPRPQRRGVALDLLVVDRLRLRRPGALLFRNLGADSDVLRHLLHHLHHRRPPRGLSALHAGLARAAYQPGAGQDPRLGYARMDPGADAPGLRPAGRGHDRPRGTGSGDCGDVPDLVHRSEEHTSELQSLRHLVCRLLLEKKKKKKLYIAVTARHKSIKTNTNAYHAY